MKTNPLARWLFAACLALNLSPVSAVSLADLAADADADALTEALVRRRLSQDDLSPYHRIEVAVRDGVVTLTGSARTKSTLDAALREVEKVSGVEGVEERVKVEPNP